MEMPFQASPRRDPQPTIRVELAGSDTCSALGITARSSSPVLALCRRLLDAGHDRATPMQIFRGETLALTVRSIGEAAGLEVNHRGTGFVARCEGRPAPPMRLPGRHGATRRANP